MRPDSVVDVKSRNANLNDFVAAVVVVVVNVANHLLARFAHPNLTHFDAGLGDLVGEAVRAAENGTKLRGQSNKNVSNC